MHSKKSRAYDTKSVCKTFYLTQLIRYPILDGLGLKVFGMVPHQFSKFLQILVDLCGQLSRDYSVASQIRIIQLLIFIEKVSPLPGFEAWPTRYQANMLPTELSWLGSLLEHLPITFKYVIWKLSRISHKVIQNWK